MVDTTSGASALRPARSIAAAKRRGVRVSAGAENTRAAGTPQAGHGTSLVASPMGNDTVNS